jgi:predicted dehydrogenase
MAAEPGTMRVLVVGSGPAGRRHAANVSVLGHEPAIARRAGLETESLARELGVAVFAGLEAAETWSPEAVIVATPPSAHAEAAEWALHRALPVLVEKPLTHAAASARALAETARGGRLVVGYNLRFHPALRAIESAVAAGRIGAVLSARAEVGSHLPSWHPEEDYRAGAAARAELGGGALLTLAHELDVVLWIGGPAELVAGAAARVSQLEVDVDDVAELVLRHRSGALSSVHMDFLDRAYNRRSRWIGADATLDWTWNGPVRLIDGDREELLWHDEGFDLARTYLDEVAAFLAGDDSPGDQLGDAVRALEIAEAVMRP